MPNDSYRFPARSNMRYRLIPFPVFKRRFWEQLAPLLVDHYDLLHLPYDSCVTRKRAKLVVTVHDVKPLAVGGSIRRCNVNSLVERVLMRDQWARIDLTPSARARYYATTGIDA